jgi:hypothetical protein
LIEAIKKNDTPTAIALLNQGADAKCPLPQQQGSKERRFSFASPSGLLYSSKPASIPILLPFCILSQVGADRGKREKE